MKNIKATPMSEEKKSMNLYQKLVEVRKSVLYVAKGDTGHNFKYANTADLLGAIRPKMDEMGVLLVSNMERFERIMPKGMEITMSYTWVNAENPTEQLRTNYTFYEERMTGCQGVGSVLTYGERYFLYKFLSVATDSDAPEKFYATHGLSPVEEEQPRPKQEQAPDYRRKFEPISKVSVKIWEEMQRVDPSINNLSAKEALPYYLFFTQNKHKSVDIIADIKKQLKDPQQIVQTVLAWLNHADGAALMERLQWERAQESYSESA